MTTEYQRYTEDQVVGEIERMKQARPKCDKCPQISFEAVLRGYWFSLFMDAVRSEALGHFLNTTSSPNDLHMQREQAWQYMRNAGFQEMPDAAGWIKRCVTCATSQAFPWADKLDVARVMHFVNTDPRCESIVDLALLEETIPGYVRPPVQPAQVLKPSPNSFETIAAEEGGFGEAQTLLSK